MMSIRPDGIFDNDLQHEGRGSIFATPVCMVRNVYVSAHISSCGLHQLRPLLPYFLRSFPDTMNPFGLVYRPRDTGHTDLQ